VAEAPARPRTRKIPATNGAVRAIAYMEAIVRPFAGWEHWSEKSRGIFQALRSPAGEQMVLDENLFVEKILPMAVLRELTDEEMAGVPPAVRCPGRRPSADARVAAPAADRGRACRRRRDLRRLRRVGGGDAGHPEAVLQRRARGDPHRREFCRTWPDQAEVTVAGSHFVQEDSGSDIGRVIADWLARIR
jgi:haloalkane dehalogenase